MTKTNTSYVAEIILVMKPKSSPAPLIRIGGNGDGAYLIPNDLEGIAACFSPGVNNFKNFEDELTDVYGIKCHMCDYSSDVQKLKTPLVEGMQTFKKKWLDIDSGDDSISLEEWVLELSPNENEDLILQMDIEGAEFRNILHCPDDTLRRFRIIVIEIHGLGVAKEPTEFEKQLGPLLRKLDKLFTCVHAHPNNCGGDFVLPGSGLNLPYTHELTFLRKDRFKQKGKSYPSLIPHPLDIKSNVWRNPPLFLNEKWCENGVRKSASTIKMLEDKLDYYVRAFQEHKNETAATVLTIHQLSQQILARFYSETSLKIDDGSAADIADGKHFYLSSNLGKFPKEGFVKSKSPFFFHTGFGVNQYITVDLGEEYELFSLVVGNRIDGCRERARCLFYVAHQTKEPNLRFGLPLSIDKTFYERKASKCETPLLNARARYLTIFSPEKTALHFESIRIHGRPC